jgi:ankyrin repeat protein
MDSATVQLGELITTSTSPYYTATLMHKIATLLDKGADVNIAVCVYRSSSGSLVCRLLGSNPVIDSLFDRRWNGWSPADNASKFQHLGSPISVATPLIDAAGADNEEALSFFAQRGARIEPILERLSSNLISIDRLWVPLLLPGKGASYQSIQKLLDLAGPENALVQRWVQVAFNNVATSGGDKHLALMLLLHGAQPTTRELNSGSSQAVFDLATRHQIFPAALSTSDSGFIRLVFLDNVDLCALVPRDKSSRTARGHFGKTSLMIAVGNKSAAMCKFLLDSGADPNECDDFGMTALMEAIYYGHEEAVNLLLARGAETKRQDVPVRAAKKKSRVQPQNSALDYFPVGHDDQWNECARMCERRGWHAIHLAAHKGRLNALRALCNASADLAALNDAGCSPLDVAMRNSQDLAAYYLLSRKCKFDAKSPAASRLLTQAVTDCRHDIVTQMIKYGVLPSPCSGLGGEHTVVETLSKMKEQSLILLPPRVLEMCLPKDHKGITADLCVNCSIYLTTAKFSPAPESDPSCRFCQLLGDCSLDKPDHLPELRYSMKDGAKDDELVTVSPELTFRHPIKKIEGEICIPYLLHILELTIEV